MKQVDQKCNFPHVVTHAESIKARLVAHMDCPHCPGAIMIYVEGSLITVQHVVGADAAKDGGGGT